MTGRLIVLASASPRRKQLMADLGIDCEVITADVDETPLPAESPTELAERLARSKARAVAVRAEVGNGAALVIAADTVVALGSDILGKPVDEQDARRMLLRLRAGEHQVHSAVCVLDVQSGECRTIVNTTQVLMRPYETDEIHRYVASRDPLDKAGAYAIQHSEFAPVREFDGCLSGVMGLPLGDLCDLLAQFGVTPTTPIVEVCERQADFACCRR
jgi:septum formation protein